MDRLRQFGVGGGAPEWKPNIDDRCRDCRWFEPAPDDAQPRDLGFCLQPDNMYFVYGLESTYAIDCTRFEPRWA